MPHLILRSAAGFVTCLLLCWPLSQVAASEGTDATQSTDATIDALKAQVEQLTRRLNQLEQSTARREVRVENLDARVAETAQQQRANPASWTERIRFKGDLRYRHEYTDKDGSKIRNRERLRARASLLAQVNDTVKLGIGVATGGSSPVSSNQTLDGGFSTKDLGLDLAYATWETPVEGLSLTAGKFKTPMHRAGGGGLIWDGDLRPEGAAMNYDNGQMFGSAAVLWVDEVSQDDDIFLLTGQLGWRHAFDRGELTAGTGYYHYTNIEGSTPIPDGKARGNVLDAQGNYATGFNEFELFTEFAFADLPLSLYADYVRNLDAGNFDTAFALGGRWEGKPGGHKLRLEYYYEALDANSLLGAYTDSDFGGGQTDATGHVMKGTYWFTDAVYLKTFLFLNEIGADAGTGSDFTRLFLDLNFKF